MDKAGKDAIRELVLDLRETLEAEIKRELGRYGIYTDRAWIDASDLARLSDKERDQDRPRIEGVIRREQEAGLSRAEAVRAFIRETAYTHMNRLFGLKCMEVRGLIEETITTRSIYSDRSKRHRDYLEEHENGHREPDKGLAAVLRQSYAEISQHIGVVFDPDSDHCIVWPRHTVLKECVASINAVDEEVASELGQGPETMPSAYADDTILGWVYQYFQEKEKKRVFDDVRKKRKKIGGYDIIPATTAYTERYMVQFLVENSLGALWMEMYPDSDLCDGWEYFVEDPNLQNGDTTRKQGRDPRPVAELTLLDPACGSGHFLLYAFDLFAQMYEAEVRMERHALDRAEIGRRILRDNLYGIDIDLRSIQLSALNLYMKACTYARVRLDELQNGDPVQMNLVCADIVLHRGNELGELLDLFKDDHLTQDLIKTIWRGLENARELGSLLKVEEQVDAVVARKRKAETDTFWEHPEELWEQWKLDFMNTLKEYVDRAAESFDVNRRMFGQEAIKGVRFLGLLTRRYNVVATNPPYMTSGNMADTLREELRDLEAEGHYDLFAMFIMRSLNLSPTGGFAALITQHSFMFTKRYTSLRKALFDRATIRTLAHLGPGAFADIGGEVVNTAMYVLRRATDKESPGVYFRMVNSKDKALELRNEINLRAGPGLRSFALAQSKMSRIEGSPISYWATSEILELLPEAKPLEDFADIVFGMKTANNARYIRCWWEIDDPGRRWKRFAKSGSGLTYYQASQHYVDWSESAVDHYSTYYSAQLPNRKYWFREGIIYSDVTTRKFTAKYLPPGQMTNFRANLVTAHDPETLLYILGFLSSKLAEYVLALLNPTLSFAVQDLKRLPFILASPRAKSLVTKLVEANIECRRYLASFRPVDPDLKQTSTEEFCGIRNKEKLSDSLIAFVRSKEAALARLEINAATIEMLFRGVYELSPRTYKAIFYEQGILSAFAPILVDYEAIPDNLLDESCDLIRSLQRVTIERWATTHRELHQGCPELPPRQLLESELTRLYVDERRSLEDVCTTLALNPISVVALRREMGLVNPADLKHEVENFLTHRVWELCKRDEDGIIPYADQLKNRSLLEQVRGEIEDVFSADRAVAIEAEMDGILGRGGLEQWLENAFFKKHVSQFRKRPILWQITSPDQQFRVLVYYHKLDHDTLPKIRSQYLWPLLERAKTRLRAARTQDPPGIKTIGDLEAYMADLKECDQLLENVIEGTIEVDLPDWVNGPYRDGKAPYDPDLGDGVKVNILPLQAAGLLPRKKVV